MRVSVKAKPNACEEKIEKIDEDNFIISVKELPVRGMANRAIVRVLAKYFKVSPDRVSIISGQTSRNKIVEVQ